MSATGTAVGEPVKDAQAPHSHRFPIRIYYEDTDAGGIVYHASYLRFAERARTEFLRAQGFSHPPLANARGLIFAAHRIEVDFIRPAVLDDLLEVETRLLSLRGASFTLAQPIRRGGERVAELVVRLAVLNRALRPVRVPDDVRRALRDPRTRV